LFGRVLECGEAEGSKLRGLWWSRRCEVPKIDIWRIRYPAVPNQASALMAARSIHRHGAIWHNSNPTYPYEYQDCPNYNRFRHAEQTKFAWLHESPVVEL
jgi:hypothetical protein